ncbi:uncharacterized protein LOC131239849 isoform X2 [Magnolia sinica]|uniref:uncharacterized protein LOC131239849 isoform X2 n=1 Tax=Magnolia sinica TaxID=86752 RepID=UPI002659F67C|nr:uncharacterized protein LOC131239849 isoform X2 [Magnolia sinica]
MQKKPAENKRPQPPSRVEPAPDLTDFMNDWFFGSVPVDPTRTYNLTGGHLNEEEEEEGEDDYYEGPRSGTSSKLTQEWLEEAKRMVAMSPGRHESPSRLVGSPRFAAAKASASLAFIERRDPLSRSARRHRSGESFSGEILSKTVKHGRNRSETFEPQQLNRQTSDKLPASSVQQWFSNVLKLDSKQQQQQQQQQPQQQEDSLDEYNPAVQQLRPPRQAIRRKSRFQDDISDQQTAARPVLSRRTFRAGAPDPENPLLSPPKNLVESTHRRSISSSTCSLDKLSRPDADVVKEGPKPGSDEEVGVGRLNSFLKDQRAKIGMISSGEVSAKARIILSGSSNSTSSMVAAICYAWLLENKEDEEEGWSVVVPVMNMKRGRMWKQRQAAWLLHHVGIDATAILFSNEVDLESLVMAKQLSVLVIGQDVLRKNGEVGSQCTILTDNYCEDAYELLQTPYLKTLLLAGILLDTQNLNATAKFSSNKDAEAVQLLLVGSSPNQRFELYDQLMQDQQENSFLEALSYNYVKPSNESDDENEAPTEHRVPVRKSTSSPQQDINTRASNIIPTDTENIKIQAVSPKSARKKPSAATVPVPTPTQAAGPAPRGKNKFFLAKWFGLGSK